MRRMRSRDTQVEEAMQSSTYVLNLLLTKCCVPLSRGCHLPRLPVLTNPLLSGEAASTEEQQSKPHGLEVYGVGEGINKRK